MKKMWKCSVCGYIHEGEDVLDKCPKCGAPKEKLIQLSEEEATKVINSERTNDIHMKIVGMMDKLTNLCNEGIEINLDPMCVKAFEKAMADAKVIKNIVKAELEGHMKKGKW